MRAQLPEASDSEFYPSGIVSGRFNYGGNTNHAGWVITSFKKNDNDGKFIERFSKKLDNTKNKYRYGYHQWREFDETGLPQNAFWNEFDSTWYPSSRLIGPF